jgi:hypothetical protein
MTKEHLNKHSLTRICPVCKGTGVSKESHQRYTTGGHDDRSCPYCHGDGFIELVSSTQEDKRKLLKIESVDVLEIQSVKEDCLIVKVLLDKELVEFEFRMTYDPKLNATLIAPSRNFLDLAKRYESPLGNEIFDLVKKVINKEPLSFPVTLNFTS